MEDEVQNQFFFIKRTNTSDRNSFRHIFHSMIKFVDNNLSFLSEKM